MVLSIIDSILKHIKTKLGRRNLFIRSDNAGCYHSQMIIGFISNLANKHNHNLLLRDILKSML